MIEEDSLYLHGCQGQHDRHVDLNDHVNEVLSKEPGSKADDDQKHCGDEHGEQIVDNWSPKGDFDDDSFLVVDG